MPFRSIVAKIIIVFFMIGILPMLFFNLLYYTDYQTINDRIFETNMTKITNEKAKVLSLTLKQFEASVEELSQWVQYTHSDLSALDRESFESDNFMNENKSIYIPDDSNISQDIKFDIKLSENLYAHLVSAYERTNKQGWIYVITKNDVLTIYPNSDLTSFGKNHQFENDIYYYLADPAHNPQKKTLWTSPYYDWLGQGWMITCTSPIYIDGQFYGIAAVDLTLDSIRNLVKDEFFYDSGYSFLINKKADVIYHPNVKMSQPAAGVTLYENALSDAFSKEYQKVINEIIQNAAGSSYYFDKQTNSSKFVVYDQVEGTDFILGIESPIKTNVLSDSTYGNYIVSISIPLITLMTFVGIYLFRKISRPIQELAIAASTFEMGEISSLKTMEVHSSDEIGVLQESFNKMITTIQMNTNQLVQKNKEMVSVFNSVPGITYISDHDYNIELISDAITAFKFGEVHEASQTTKRSKCYQLVFGSEAPCDYCPRLDAAAHSSKIKEIRVNNQVYTLASNFVLDTNNQTKKWIVNVQDITDEKLTQQSISQNEKLIGIGQIVAGITHEIRNPLASIKGAQFLYKTIISQEMSDHPLKSELMTIYDDMQYSIEETEKIVHNLLDFSRQSQSNECKADVVKVIDQILILLKHEMVKRHVTVDRAYSNENCLVAVEREKLKSIFFNIILNAVESMTIEDGKLEISISNNDKSYARVEIKDNGKGIPVDIQERIFEPFTTSGKENGTGLGLWIVKREVDASGGKIQFFSTETYGTTFIILLPKMKSDGVDSFETKQNYDD